MSLDCVNGTATGGIISPKDDGPQNLFDETFEDYESFDEYEKRLEDCEDPNERAALLEKMGKEELPFYFLEDTRGFDAEGVRARAEGFRFLRDVSPKQYQRISNDLEKRGVMRRAELDDLVDARYQQLISEALIVKRASASKNRTGSLIKAKRFAWQNSTAIPRRECLYSKHYFRRYLSTTVSPGGLGKSALATVEILAMVTGKNLLGEVSAAPLRVWYWNGEDPEDELQRRFAAACLHYGISSEDVGGRLFINSGRDTPIIVALDDKSGLRIAQPLLDALWVQIIAHQIDVLVIDPFVSSHGVPENDNVKINAVLRQWAKLADETGCAIELVHHTRKPAAGKAAEYSVDDARGAGAMIAAVRSARTLNVMSKDEAGKLGISEDQRRSYFRVDNGKANLAPPAARSTWRHHVSVQLGNGGTDSTHPGDSVGVVTAWTLPDPTEDITPDDIQEVHELVAAGEWRENPQATNWVGHAIAEALGLDLAGPSVKARVKELQRSWVKEGVLKLVRRKNAKREIKTFVEVGKRG